MTTWARLAAQTQLEHNFNSFPPSDHWAQVDVWIPELNPCPSPANPGLGSTPYFLYNPGFTDGLAALSATSPVPSWRWQSFLQQAASGPSPATPYTVGYHVHGSTVDWYVNGVLVITDTPSSFFAYNHLLLNAFAPGCCCRVVYYTNVLVGTSQGAGDLFSDDFSGGFTPNWYVTAQTGPASASLVAAPSAATPCPTVTVSPTHGQPGDTITISGSGFTPSVPLSLSWQTPFGWTPIGVVATSDGAGTFHTTIEVPHGLGTNSNPFGNPSIESVYVIDAAGLLGCGSFSVCGANASDGIRAEVDGDGFNTDLPDPVVAAGGTDGMSNNNVVLDYIFHDGDHWILWADPSAIDNAGTFPPPANHTMTATRISPDGSSVTDYPIDTEYAWEFNSGDDNDPGLGDTWPGCGSASPVWSRVSFFSGWAKPIYDAHFASDGTTLWVGIVTAETVPYPWIDNKDAHGHNPGGAAQQVPLSVLTSGFTTFATSTSGGYLRYYTNPTGAINIFKDTAFPLTDAGIQTMGVWNPPVVAIFSFGGGGFNRIGSVTAKFCPSVIGQTDGYQNVGGSIIGGIGAVNEAPRGSLFSRVALAASETDPGVCHVVWSEGGDWGRVADGTACVTGPFGGSRTTWDAGPPNRSYRVNYTTWSPSALLTDDDIAGSFQDRTNWHFTWSWGSYPSEFNTGYTWPAEDQFGAFVVFDLRCDNANGDVLLFVAPSSLINLPFEPEFDDPSPDAGGHTWDDFSMIYCDTLKVYDITGGVAVLKHSITADLLPTEAEVDWSYPANPATNQPDSTQPLKASDCIFGGPLPFDAFNGKPVASAGPQDKAFGISTIYEDPLLGGTPVYLVHVPWARREAFLPGFGSTPSFGSFPMRGFYRIPADMSAGFDFLDGERQPRFTILGPTGFINQSSFGNGDFFSDPRNIWIPSTVGPRSRGGGASGLWFDRVCKNQWQTIEAAETPGDFSDVPVVQVGEAACPGFNYDPASDEINVAAPVASGSLFAVTGLFICRGCASCRCGVGVHIVRRF